MKLGFVSAILPELTLEEVLAFAAGEGFGCVELMCWPPGAADRRYAGVTHIDVTNFTDEQAGRVRELAQRYGVAISGLGYYPNPLAADPEGSRPYFRRLRALASEYGLDELSMGTSQDYRVAVEEGATYVRVGEALFGPASPAPEQG